MAKKNTKFGFEYGVVLLSLNLAFNLRAMDDALLAELHGATGSDLKLPDLRSGGTATKILTGGDGDTDSSGSSSCGDRVSAGSYSTNTRMTLAILDRAGAELAHKYLFASSVRSVAEDSVCEGVVADAVVGTSVDGAADLDSVAMRMADGDALREFTKSAPPAVSPVLRRQSNEMLHLVIGITATRVQGIAFPKKDSTEYSKFDYVGSADGSGPRDRS